MESELLEVIVPSKPHDEADSGASYNHGRKPRLFRPVISPNSTRDVKRSSDSHARHALQRSANPTYRTVCNGDGALPSLLFACRFLQCPIWLENRRPAKHGATRPGHAESVQIEYDPDIISYKAGREASVHWL